VARPAVNGPVAFAGLWETWTGPNGEEMETAAIVTTQANAEMAAIHHRAPVIVPPQDFDTWMDCGRFGVRAASELLRPAPDGTMDVYEVAPAVNKVANDSPDLLEPFTAPPGPVTAAPAKPAHDDRQGSLF